jgi:alkylation response protein AidB-like acyl-CoA dehydrogenase
VVTDAGDLVEELRRHLTAALCCVAAGVCQAALEMTATHTAKREQFGKPIASFQAVGQRAADAYIDSELVELTALQAAWRLSAGWPADEEIAVAKFWAGDGGMRVVHACQHLHGGLGVDLDYPLHRYFLWAKQIEHELGTPTRQLLDLGAHLAATPV